MSATQQKRREWPGYVALAALVVFTLAIPFLALTRIHWLGVRTAAQVADDSTVGYLIAASDGIAIVLACVAAFAGGRTARVMAAVTIPLALIGAMAFGVFLVR